MVLRRFYRIDKDGNITRDAVALRRDAQGRIDQLTVGDAGYRFTLDAAGNVTAYSLLDANAGITVSAISGDVSESGGTATFSIVLNTPPTADVRIALNSSDATEGSVSPAILTFTSANWNTAQAVRVSGVDDPVDDGDVAFSIITAAAVSADLNYDLRNAADVILHNRDDGTAGITALPFCGDVSESGGAASATVTITVNPIQPSQISISNLALREGRAGKTTTFTFTVTRTGDTSQAVTVYYATADGTGPGAATVGVDYLAASGELVFGVGETTKTISVTVKGDSTVEDDEFFFLRLTDEFFNELAVGTGTIINDDR